MRKITFLFFAIFASANIYSQTYTISFAATGAATIVDSVKVENLTHPATVKWHAGDILQLILSNGINGLNVNNENLKIYPNPMQEQTEISFYVKQAGNVKISIYDIAGKEVLHTEDKLLQGTHKYHLTGLKQSLYFVNISGDSYFCTAKLISQNTTFSEAKIKYIGNEKSEVIIGALKSTKATITMAYTTGDWIRFTGYAGSLTAIVNDMPTSSITVNFAFVAPSCPTTVSDIDGNTYNTVLIGTQCWMAENLRFLPSVVGQATGSLTTPYYYVYDYNGTVVADAKATTNFNTYGVLYNWLAAMNGAASSTANPSGVQGVCPTGWHLPSDAEWTELTDYLGGINVAGGKLKEIGLTHWNGPNIGTTNESGFTALPGGYRYFSGTFALIGDGGYWWSSTEYYSNETWTRGLSGGNSIVYSYGWDKRYGLSVRCLWDF